jgi:O-antigen/teichoic acid export membrane protein
MAPESAEAVGGATWEQGILGKLAGLAGARLAAQALGLAWFLIAARTLDPVDFGVLSTGLVLVVVIGGLSDLGTTRTVVRHVAGDRAALHRTFLRAVAVRAGAGLVVGAVAVLLASVLDQSVPLSVVFAAALIAVASGITEVGFAALRAVGLVRAEVSLLVAERVLFVAVGVTILALGYGPLAVLLVYAATNAVSATIVSTRILRDAGGRGSPAGRMLDREGRRTAVSSTLVIVGPRISALLLVLLATPTVVGTFAIAQEIPDSLGTLGTAALMPVLALVRAGVVGGWRARALERGGRVAAAVTAAIIPVAIWATVDARRVLDLLFKAGNRPGAVVTLGLLSAASVVWVVRTFGELVLLADERARPYVGALALGAAVNVAAGIALVPRWDAPGAAGAFLAAELVIFVVVAVAVRGIFTRAVLGPFVPAAVVALGAGVSLPAVRSLPIGVGIVLTGVWCLVGLVVVGLPLRDRPSADVAASGTNGHDADVGEQVDRYLAVDGIETIEHLSRPADHL